MDSCFLSSVIGVIKRLNSSLIQDLPVSNVTGRRAKAEGDVGKTPTAVEKKK